MRVATKNRFDEKTLKQKARKTEKDAMRELKKDSFAIQKARETERQQRKKVSVRVLIPSVKDIDIDMKLTKITFQILKKMA